MLIALSLSLVAALVQTPNQGYQTYIFALTPEHYKRDTVSLLRGKFINHPESLAEDLKKNKLRLMPMTGKTALVYEPEILFEDQQAELLHLIDAVGTKGSMTYGQLPDTLKRGVLGDAATMTDPPMMPSDKSPVMISVSRSFTISKDGKDISLGIASEVSGKEIQRLRTTAIPGRKMTDLEIKDARSVFDNPEKMLMQEMPRAFVIDTGLFDPTSNAKLIDMSNKLIVKRIQENVDAARALEDQLIEKIMGTQPYADIDYSSLPADQKKKITSSLETNFAQLGFNSFAEAQSWLQSARVSSTSDNLVMMFGLDPSTGAGGGFQIMPSHQNKTTGGKHI